MPTPRVGEELVTGCVALPRVGIHPWCATPYSSLMRLRLGMVGGGPGAFIGAVHRLVAEMDREFRLVAGAGFEPAIPRL